MNQKPSVLIVDDESGILDTLRILLRNEPEHDGDKRQ